ncbi:30S ribosomal protein S6 [Candidatus Saccharibacteria bacterium]|nr:30S ribosomal protein S6 [Candidatus Saccharibacteria bacterium]
MRQYELTVLIHPDLEMNLQPALDKAKKIIEENGGKITKETNEGKRRLAYKVAGQEFAVFYYYEIDLPEDKKAAKKVADSLDLADEFIRYLLVTVDERRLKMEAKRKARKGAEDEETEEETKEEEKEEA